MTWNHSTEFDVNGSDIERANRRLYSQVIAIASQECQIVGSTGLLESRREMTFSFQISILAIEIQRPCGRFLQRSSYSSGVQWFCAKRKTRCAYSLSMVSRLIHVKVVLAENHSVYSTAKHKVSASTPTAVIIIPGCLFSQQASTILRWSGCRERGIQRDQLEWLQKQISRAAFLSAGFVCFILGNPSFTL